MTPAREVAAMLGPGDRGAILSVAALAGVVAALTLGRAEAPFVGGLGGLCLAIALVDGRRFIIPDLLTIALAGLGVMELALLHPGQILSRAGAVLGLAVVLGLLRAGLSRWKGRTAMGLGDLKLLAAAAVWLPVAALPAYVFLSAASGLAEMLLLRSTTGRLAFGRHLAPWLCLCVVLCPWILAATAPA